MTFRPQIIMVGPHLNVKGGISAVISLYKENGFLERIPFIASFVDGSHIKKILYYQLFLIRYLFTLIRYPSIRIVHIHMATHGSFIRKSISILMARALGKKVVVHIHAGMFNRFYTNSPPWYQQFIRFIALQCTYFIVLSPQWKEWVNNVLKHPNIKVVFNPVVIQPNPVNLERHRDKSIFVLLGRLDQNKGVFDIIEAAPNIKNPQVEIHMYGDGDLDKVEQAVKRANVQNRIYIHRWISPSEKHEVLKNADVILLPSYAEGLPLSVLEALSYGIPVITTPVGGIPEVVEDGINGYLISPGDQKALVESIDKLANDISLRQNMGAKGYQIAKEKFDVQKIMSQLNGYYEILLTE